MTAPNDQFYLFRHVRNGKVNDGDATISNLGGVSLYIFVDQLDAKLTFSVAVNGDKENFNKLVATNITRGRFNAGQVVAGDYDRTKSLVDNCITLLQQSIDYDGLLGDPVPLALRAAALQRLKSYTKRLPRATFTGSKVPRSEDPATWPFPVTTRPQ